MANCSKEENAPICYAKRPSWLPVDVVIFYGLAFLFDKNRLQVHNVFIPAEPHRCRGKARSLARCIGDTILSSQE